MWFLKIGSADEGGECSGFTCTNLKLFFSQRCGVTPPNIVTKNKDIREQFKFLRINNI